MLDNRLFIKEISLNYTELIRIFRSGSYHIGTDSIGGRDTPDPFLQLKSTCTSHFVSVELNSG